MWVGRCGCGTAEIQALDLPPPSDTDSPFMIIVGKITGRIQEALIENEEIDLS